jgi:hypothetical protein
LSFRGPSNVPDCPPGKAVLIIVKKMAF